MEAVRAAGVVPTYCIFNGDLANFGRREEFAQGERWLERLLPGEWNTKLLIVPGNHDIDRKGTRPALFRAVVREQKVYTDWTRAKNVNCDHLETFFGWHKEVSGRIAMAGDWNSPFGFLFQDQSFPVPINIIELNSALFCCGDDDEGNLVVDVKTLNAFLEAASQTPGAAGPRDLCAIESEAQDRRQHAGYLLFIDSFRRVGRHTLKRAHYREGSGRDPDSKRA